MKKIIIHSHRGQDFGTDNTLRAFRAALNAGCGLELDVRLTRDKQIAIVHNSNLHNVTGVNDTVSNLSMSEIQKVAIIGTNEHIPSFDDFANLLQQFSLQQDAIAIHLKEAEQTQSMMTLLAKKVRHFGLEKTIFIFDVTRQAIDSLRQYNPNLRLAISLGADRHSSTIFTNHDLPQFSDVPIIWWDEWGEVNGKSYAGTLYTQHNLHLLQQKGYKVYAISPDVAYQSNHVLARDHKYLPKWQNLIDWKIDGICTDAASELLSFINK